MSSDLVTFQYVGATELNRVTLDAGGITLEARAVVGAFYPWQRLFWDEVLGVYVWESHDWTAVVVGALIGAAALAAAGVIYLCEGPALYSLISSGAGGAAIGVGLWLGMRVRRRCCIRLEAGSSSVQFHTSRADVVPFLLARLGIARSENSELAAAGAP